MSNIPEAHEGPSPDTQRILDYLCERPNQQFTLEQIAQAVGCTEDEAQVRLESLVYQQQIMEERPEGGKAVYYRRQLT